MKNIWFWSEENSYFYKSAKLIIENFLALNSEYYTRKSRLR
jgi:hypothetical protein